MHDGAALEKMGVPTATVCTAEFEFAAEVQAKALGVPDLKAVFVSHPVQSLTPDQIREKADAVFDRIVEVLTAAG